MRIVRYLGEHKGAVLLVALLLLCQVFADLLLPLITADIVDVGIMQSGIEAASAEEAAVLRAQLQSAGEDVVAVQTGYLLVKGAQMLGLTALSAAFAVCITLIAARTGAKVGFDLRNRLFERVMSFSEGEIGRFSAASLITRCTNDIQLIQMVVTMLLRMVLSAPILAVGGIVMVMTTNASMGWVVVLAVLAVFAVVAVLFALAMPKFRIMQKLIDRVNLVSREMLTGMPVVRAFGRERHEEERFDAASLHLMRTQLFTNRVMTFMMPTMMLIMNAASAVIVWVGGGYIESGIMQTGDLIAFITYAMVIIMGFLMLGMLAILLPRAEVAAGRIDEVLACEPSIKDPAEHAGESYGAEHAEGEVSSVGRTGQSPVPTESSSIERDTPPQQFSARGEGDAPSPETPVGTGLCPVRPAEADVRPVSASEPRRGARVVFDDVSFRYDDTSENVLEHVSFVAEPGATLALIGATGSGKSTALKLIERFYDVSAGSVSVDGRDVREWPLAVLRKQIGSVPQKSFLFEGTVASNVAYSDESMPAERIEWAIDVAQAGFVRELPGGLEAPISQGGTNVSGGQRQRLAIARAIATDARVLLLDDSFSALDTKTDAALRRALDRELAEVTRIVVAQRVSTIMDADCIVVLDDGHVAGMGTHRRLLESCEEYREIALSQLSADELNLGGDAA